ncbi:pyroglutamyl-peptidase I [Streptobacillus moniliformis]|uniref:pyroglutamyl-peptidase I n=1 Tax=Streptobacillus moniliformis TaxID=34105 RepID=UPI0007E3D775|nr:pyroglutamyl-peptidase I [Streptobacillus moniliformis]
MDKILITAFEPFGGEKINSTEKVLNFLPEKIGNLEIIKLLLPVVRNKSLCKIKDKIMEEKPKYILSLGQAGGSKNIAIERIGINVDDYRIKDNSGNQPIDEKIFCDGENAYFSTLPIKKIYEKLENKGYSVKISNTAGTFVCNHVLYGIRYMIEKEKLDIKSGFIHIPYIDEQVKDDNTFSMSIKDILNAIICAIEVIENYEKDEKIVAGEIF